MSTNPEAKSPAPAQPGNLSPEARQILAQAGALQEAQQPGQARVGEPEAPQELEVDMGDGVKRRVRVADLADTYRRRLELDNTKQVLEQRLAEMGELHAVRALQERIGSLDATRRQQVLSLLQGTPQDPPAGEDTDEEIVREAFGDSARGKQPSRGLQPDPRIERLEEAIQALAAAENGRRREREVQTTGQRVDALMTEFPVFRDGDEAARAFAKDSIMAQVAAAPRGTALEDVVHRAAAKMQEIVARRQAAAMEDLGVPTQPRTKIPDGVLTAKGLKSGLVRQLAMEQLRRAR